MFQQFHPLYLALVFSFFPAKAEGVEVGRDAAARYFESDRRIFSQRLTYPQVLYLGARGSGDSSSSSGGGSESFVPSFGGRFTLNSTDVMIEFHQTDVGGSGARLGMLWPKQTSFPLSFLLAGEGFAKSVEANAHFGVVWQSVLGSGWGLQLELVRQVKVLSLDEEKKGLETVGMGMQLGWFF